VSLLLLTLAVALTLPVQASAQGFPGDRVPVRPVRIEGYWDKTKDDPKVIGEVTLSFEGKDRRRFGITAIQAYKPEEEGMAVLRHTSLQPALLVRGPKPMVDKLASAPPDQKVTILGVYNAGSGTLVLSSVDVGS
jgi:hypothetical protein